MSELVPHEVGGHEIPIWGTGHIQLKQMKLVSFLHIYNCHFEKGTVSLGGMAISSAEIKLSTFSQKVICKGRFIFSENQTKIACHFSGCEFQYLTDFTGSKFHRDAPYFANAALYSDTRFPLFPDSWPQPSVGSEAEVQINNMYSYGILKHLFLEMSRPDEVSFFSMMKTKEKYAHERGIMTWISSLYSVVPDRSRFAVRPAIWLGIVWSIGAAAFSGYFSGCCVLQHKQNVEVGALAGLGLSLTNCLPFLGMKASYWGDAFSQGLPPVLKFLSGMQNLLSVPLWFLLGLGLRHQFRVK